MSPRLERLAEGVEIWLGDCRDVLPMLDPVDAVVTDPPYGIGFQYESHVDDPEAYPGFLWPRIEAAEALVRPGGPIFVWQAQAWMPRFAELFPRQWRVFVAARNFVQMRPGAMQHAYDPVVVWWKEGAAPEEWGKELGLGKRDWFIADSARQVLRTTSFEKEHPCPRQVDSCHYIVGIWCRPSGIVLDPFCGSGTIGVAAIGRGRRFVGIEIDQKYFDLSCRRISAALEQPDIFIERAAPMKQEALAL